MTIRVNDYVPVLKWRMGEYQALLQLTSAQKERVVPLIEVTKPDFDFETQQPKKTVDEHFEKFASRLSIKWGSRRALLDGGLLEASARMANGVHPVIYLHTTANNEGCNPIPVTSIERDSHYQTAVRTVDQSFQTGVALRCTLEETLDPDFGANAANLLQILTCQPSNTDIVLDLGAPNFDPIVDLVSLVTLAFSSSSIFQSARSVTIVGTSFPDSMAKIQNTAEIWPRREWELYNLLISQPNPQFRIPAFGDYTISHNSLFEGDMRLIKPSATIRYAIHDAWLILKGKNVRDYKFGQYRTLSNMIVTSPHFLGAAFSAGSKYISDCASGTATTGNLPVWRRVGVNHHIAKVVSDLASIYGP
jgi:hypothetical protein